ncbi:MAG: glycosyltransferase, partial [Roseovarius sp.]
GIEAAVPLNPALEFDADFYAEDLEPRVLRELLPLPDLREGNKLAHSPARRAEGRPALYRHWLRKGLRLNAPPNLRAWALRHHGLDLPEEIARQMPALQQHLGLGVKEPRPGQPAERVTTREVCAAMLADPAEAVRALDLSGLASAGFVMDMAEALDPAHAPPRDEAAREPAATLPPNPAPAESAERLCWQVLQFHPNHARALLHLASAMKAQGRADVEPVLRSLVRPDDDIGWNRLRLASLAFETGRHEQAARELMRIPHACGGNVKLAAACRTLAHELFDEIWTNLKAQFTAHGVARTQDLLRLVLAACTPDFTTAERSGPIRCVALVGNEDLYQCKLYRVDQKAEQLRAAGLEVDVISPSLVQGEFTQRVARYDAAIFFRVPAKPPIIDAIVAAAQNGLLTFFEIDDLVFDTAHFPPSFESYAGQISAEHYAAMACGVPLYEHAMTLCDYGIASTATVAELMKSRVRTGVVLEHHNALGPLHLKALESLPHRADDGKVTLLYASGTKAHKEDFHAILEPALAEILRRHKGKVRVQLVGHFGAFRHLRLDRDAVELREPVWDFESYCHLVGQADVNLSVLAPSLVTDAKSEIKWMEAAMFGVPSVVSDTATHREVIEEGKTGFLARSPEDFVAALDRLVRDAGLRRKVGEAARAHVMEHYAIEAMGESLRAGIAALRPEPVPARPRLLVVNVFYPPQAIGGATRVVHDNVRCLKKHYGDRFDIEVLCTLEGGEEPLSVTTYSDEGVRVWAITTPWQAEGDMTTFDPRMADQFERLVERIGPDLIHFHCIQRLTASVVEVARSRPIPYLITLHDGWWVSPLQFIIDTDRQDRALYYDYSDLEAPGVPQRAKALAPLLQGAERLLPVSESFAELHRKAGLGKVQTVENGLPELAPVTRGASASGRVRLGHIGGATRHKGLHLVRNALLSRDYENLELRLVDHALAPGTESHEMWGSTPVVRVAKTPQARVAELYGSLDVLLAPSVWPESFGLVTREAMAAGLWVVASDRGGIGEGIDEGVNGFRVEVSSYAPLAECLARIDADPERFRAPPQSRPEMRLVADQVRELVALYESILGTASPE